MDEATLFRRGEQVWYCSYADDLWRVGTYGRFYRDGTFDTIPHQVFVGGDDYNWYASTRIRKTTTNRVVDQLRAKEAAHG